MPLDNRRIHLPKFIMGYMVLSKFCAWKIFTSLNTDTMNVMWVKFIIKKLGISEINLNTFLEISSNPDILFYKVT